MKDKIKISEILHKAADEFLWNGHGSFFDQPLSRYSCDAVTKAIIFLNVPYEIDSNLFEGLENMGLDTESCNQFDEFKNAIDCQAARYAWLKFAAMIAEEQGV